MARSFSTYGTGFSPKSGGKVDFGAPVITGGAGFRSTLGESVNIGNAYGALRKSGIRNDELASTSIANRAAERATATELTAAAYEAGFGAMADVKSNKLIAEAQKEAYSKATSG